MSDVEPSLSSDATAGCGAQNDRPLVSRFDKVVRRRVSWLAVGGPRVGCVKAFERRPAEHVAGSSRVAGRRPKT